LGHVTKQVIDESARYGSRQHPTMRGRIDGAVSWPVLVPGALYGAAFPERVRQPATADVHSLQAFGFPDGLLDVWAAAIPALNELQLAAVNDYGVLDGQNLLVTAPTSSGKTMVGELAALRRVLDRRRALFLLPMRALVNDKYEQFQRTYADFGVVTIRATGEISDDIPALMQGRYDICLLTYEKFTALVLANPHLLRQVGTVVVDEVQMLVDPSRGVNLEFLLTLVKANHAAGTAPQLVALSAVIGDANGVDRWLEARHLRSDTRPVPLVEGVLGGDGSYRYLDADGAEHTERAVQPIWTGKGSSQDLVIPLVRRLVDEGKQVLVFRERKGETLGCARYLAGTLGLPPATGALEALPAGDLSTASQLLRVTLGGGVGFHNTDLDRSERQVLEASFRAPETALRVLVATTTLAMGINTPASAVVIVGLEHPGPTPYTVAEYKNMVGRAGRLGYAERGEAYTIVSGALGEHQAWHQYVLGQPEDVRSQFLTPATDPRSLILRVLAALPEGADGAQREKELLGFLEGSFGAFQARHDNPSWAWSRAGLARALTELAQHQLVEPPAPGRYRLTELGRFAGQAGVRVDSIIRLVAVLRTVNVPLNSAALVTAAQVTSELDEVYLPFNRRGANTEHRRWPAELTGQDVGYQLLAGLGVGGADPLARVARAKKAMACLLYASDTPLGVLERHLTQHQREDGGVAGAVRQAAARTRDMLPTVVRVAEFLHPQLDPGGLAERTAVRLELGIPADLVELGQLLGGELSRGQYLALLHAGLADPASIDQGTPEDLLACLGDKDRVALVLERVGQRSEAGTIIAPLLPPPAE
jgi:helicase